MKALFVGLGSIGQRHLRNLKVINPNIEIIAFRSSNKNLVLSETNKIIKNKKIKNYYNLVEVNSLKKGLELNPDLIFITNPSIFHTKMLRESLNTNAFIFLEKPASHSFTELKKIMNDKSRSRIKNVFVGYQYRFHPALKYLKKMLASKKLGNIISVRAVNGEYLPNWHPYEDYKKSYASKKNLGGGALLTQIHDLDYLIWLFGFPKRISCFGGKSSNLKVDVEDNVQILMQNKNNLSISLNLNYLEFPPKRSLEVIGDRGSVVCDLVKNNLLINFINKRSLKVNFNRFKRNDMFMDELINFINFYKGKKENIITLKESLQSQYLVDKAKASLLLNKTIECKKNEF